MEQISLQARTVLSAFERVSFNLALISICCRIHGSPSLLYKDRRERFSTGFSASQALTFHLLALFFLLPRRINPSKYAVIFACFIRSRWTPTLVNDISSTIWAPCSKPAVRLFIISLLHRVSVYHRREGELHVQTNNFKRFCLRPSGLSELIQVTFNDPSSHSRRVTVEWPARPFNHSPRCFPFLCHILRESSRQTYTSPACWLMKWIVLGFQRLNT